MAFLQQAYDIYTNFQLAEYVLNAFLYLTLASVILKAGSRFHLCVYFAWPRVRADRRAG